MFKLFSKGKYNFNKQQKEKQNKIMQYYRRSFKSQLEPNRIYTRPKRTRKHQLLTTTHSSSATKLTKLATITTKDMSNKLLAKQETNNIMYNNDKEEQKNIEKTNKFEKSDKQLQTGGVNQYVIMD